MLLFALPLMLSDVYMQTVPEARLVSCLSDAKRDASAGLLAADDWLRGLNGSERAFPLQCLGMVYTQQEEWDAAEEAFTQARDALLPEDHARRARRAQLGAMAANAAMADGRPGNALALLDVARDDALAANLPINAGGIEVDRARALVALDRAGEAEEALANARTLAPQNFDVWLLSATLARRLEKLADAQSYIQTAAKLRPVDLDVGLEAGLIAVLSGHDDAAKKSWESVIVASPDSEQARTAQSYLDQLQPAQ